MKSKHKIHLIGNAHIDPVWLWRWQEGYAEIKATFRSALDRMNEFNDFIFTCGCAAYYKWIEENEPEMFEEIKQRVNEGRWKIVGGWWIQPDCNIPSGESFVRHGLYSQRYFMEKFGLISKVGYNVDSFGHNGMLPQILKKSGMDSYVFMRPGPHEKELPGDVFWWESADGSRVLTFRIPLSYTHWFKGADMDQPDERLLAIMEMTEKQNIDFMYFYGVGNHGGGPTIANLIHLKSMQEKYGCDSVMFSSPEKYFDEIKNENYCLPTVKGDLQHHSSGCYSANSQIKLSNRKAENRLLVAEKFSLIANHLLMLDYPNSKINRAWEKTLFNQFHDILGGCSIKSAYIDAFESYGESLSLGAEILNAAVQKISWAIDTNWINANSLNKDKDWALWEIDNLGVPLVIFNPHSWEICVPIQVNKELKGITDEKGNNTEIQIVRGEQTNSQDKWNTLFIACVPALGYRVYKIYKDQELIPSEKVDTLFASETLLENDYIKLEIESDTGYIKGIFDKRNNVEILKNVGAIPIVLDEYDSDTWAHGVFEFRNEIGVFTDARISLIEKGPIRAIIRVSSRYNNSLLIQDFTLYKDRPDIEVKVKLDWRETHKILKISFDVNVEEPEATYEIPYGFIKRPTTGEEEPGQQWVDVSGKVKGTREGTYGLSLLNNCKYSFDVKDSEMRMTVVRSPIFADHFGERDDLCEFMDQGIHEFKYVLIPHDGSWKEANIVKKAYETNIPPVQIIETYHNGVLPMKFEGIKIASDTIIALVLKKSEDDRGYILRCYETIGKPVDTDIEIPFLNRNWKASFGKCEIKTFMIPLNEKEDIIEINLIEMDCM